LYLPQVLHLQYLLTGIALITLLSLLVAVAGVVVLLPMRYLRAVVAAVLIQNSLISRLLHLLRYLSISVEQVQAQRLPIQTEPLVEILG
jgi:hypothetical protein